MIATLLIGLSIAMLLFLLASGLSLIFGMLGVVNFAHGALYMLGAFVAFEINRRTGNFWLALVVSFALVALMGVVIINAKNTLVTGGNVISGNQSHGVFIIGAFLPAGSAVTPSVLDGNVISRNYIGTDPAGSLNATNSLANKGDGVVILDSDGNVVGGPSDADRNVIAQNAQSGVDVLGVGLTAYNQILHNVIGTDAAGGSAGLGNKLDGITISGGNAVGTVVAANRVVNNSGHGVRINGATGTVLGGNLIGVTAAGSGVDRGNVLDGVSLNSAVGTRLDPNNVIAFNNVDGLGLFNSTLTAVAGTVIRSNKRDGVRVEEGSQNNSIGTAAGN